MRTNTDIILDTEFNTRRVGRFRIEPISFALISADGTQEFYAVSNEFNKAAALDHNFLMTKVLPKLPPEEARRSIADIRDGMNEFFGKVAAVTKATQATIWAKNGAMGDFVLLDLLFDGGFYEMMNSHGFERTHMKDTYDLYKQAGSPKLEIEIDPDVHHTAIGDVRHERKVFLACQDIIAGRSPA